MATKNTITVHTLQEAITLLNSKRVEVSAGSLVVWKKLNNAVTYLNAQLSEMLGEEETA